MAQVKHDDTRHTVSYHDMTLQKGLQISKPVFFLKLTELHICVIASDVQVTRAHVEYCSSKCISRRSFIPLHRHWQCGCRTLSRRLEAKFLEESTCRIPTQKKEHVSEMT